MLSARLGDGSPLPAWLTFDGSRFTGTPPANYHGSIEIEVSASDGSASVSDTFVLTITPVNDAPVAALALVNRNSPEDQAIDFTVPAGSFTDIDGDALTLTASLPGGDPLPSWLTFVDGRFTGQPPANFTGVLDIVVTASDGALSASSAFRLTVDSVNDAPAVLTPLADVTVAEDNAVDLTIPAGTFGDVDGDALSLSASLGNGDPLPSWLTFDAATQRLTGTPPANFDGQVDIVVTASDGMQSASSSFHLIIDPVNDAPVLVAALADVTVTGSGVLDIAVPAGSFADVDGDTLTLTARLAGGGSLPSWLSFDGTHFTGTPPAGFNGALDLEVVASDGTLSASDIFRLTIVGGNRAPTVALPLADLGILEDTAVDFTLPAASFDDPDGDALAYSATLAGGNPLPSWLAFDSATRRFTGQPPINFHGTIAITVTASDGTANVSDSFNLEITAVNDAPVILTPLADTSTIRGATIDIAIPSGSFGDPDGDALTYTARMADGSALPTWLSFAGGHLTGTVGAGALGAYDIRITASDGSLSASDNFTLTVGMLPTGPERTPGQWLLFGSGNDRVVGRGAENTTISPLGGDDYITADGWNVTMNGGAGNDIFEFLGYNGSANGGADVDTFIFDGFSLLMGGPGDSWATITDFQNGTDRIGIVNGTAGILNFANLQPFMAQNGANVDIVLKGLPTITIQNLSLADLDASDFMFGAWLTDGGFGPAPAAGAIPYPTTTAVRTISGGSIGNASERILGYGAGNTAVNAMDGNDYITSDGWNTTIYGGRGNDIIELFASNNFAMGGAGYDYFVFDSTMLDHLGDQVWATITDYHDGADKIAFLSGSDGLYSFADLLPFMTQDGDDVRIALTGHPAIVIEDTALASLDASDFLFVNQQPVVKALRANGAIRMGNTVGVTTVTANGYAGVTIGGTANGDILDFSAVTLTNIVRIQGNDGDDVITGNGAANVIWGGNGNDILRGGDGNDSLVGDAGDDVLSGGAGNDTINGSGGTDTVDYSYATANLTVSLAITAAQTVAAGDVDTITNVENLTGGSGNDTLTGTTAANTIRGGDGDDVINAGRGNDVINGGAGFDKAIFAGVSTTYSLTTSGGIVSIVDNATGADGNDGTDQLVGIEQLVFKNNVTVNISSPIILDLDGNGVTTLSANESDARYDMDGDGLADDTSWMGTGEGMLFLDRNGDGTLTNAGEFSFVNDVPGASSDLAGLRAFDTNGDGILSESDTRFTEFRIWRDEDGNGIAEDSEITTLALSGIQSINLTATAFEGNFAVGDAVIVNKGSFTRIDGSTAEFADAALTYFSATSPTAPATALASFRHSTFAEVRDGRVQIAVSIDNPRDELNALPSPIGTASAFDGTGINDPFRVADQLASALRDAIGEEPFGSQAWRRRNLLHVLEAQSGIGGLMPQDEVSAPNATAQPIHAKVDHLLAAMVQGMVTFEAPSAADGIAQWGHDTPKPVDLFA